MKTRWHVCVRLAAVSGLALLAAACNNPPEGNTGGRIDPYRSTPSDERSGKANLPALLEFSDQTAQALAMELSQIPNIQQAGTRSVLELGDIDNKTTTPTTDFELIQRRLRGQLFNSKLIRDNFLIVEGRGRMNRELERVNDTGNDQPGSHGGDTAKYDPKTTYVLQGDFYEASRGGKKKQFYFEFKLTNLASREIVFLKDYDLAQQQIND